MASALFEGATIGPLIHLAMEIDPRGCYGSKSVESYLYLGGNWHAFICACGYMVVDAQEIVEKAHLDDMDHVKHALYLFTDFVDVFVRILIIMRAALWLKPRMLGEKHTNYRGASISTSRSSKIGLQFPVGRIAWFLKAGKNPECVRVSVPVCLTVVLEYLAAEACSIDEGLEGLKISVPPGGHATGCMMKLSTAIWNAIFIGIGVLSSADASGGCRSPPPQPKKASPTPR
ncbi:Histone H2A [Corchorus olitorius]|uniref:Histone H2A n=1 Tax=Corchorus olitorius TaxID=93759 RepID=A0A1R3K748_9ROSI|nr:Histone H2A [Corchorus olitorius]